MLNMRGLISPAGAASKDFEIDLTNYRLQKSVPECSLNARWQYANSTKKSKKNHNQGQSPWIDRLHAMLAFLELPASHQGIAKRTARYIPWDWALACRRHCFNAWRQMDMEQRTSLLMDWFFWGGKISWGPISPLECDHFCCHFFLNVFQLILNFLLNFLYDENHSFFWKVRFKRNAYTCTHVENYVCDSSHSHFASCVFWGEPASGLNQNEGREKYVWNFDSPARRRGSLAGA